jgi:alkylation response protein AidB-like acyl-CoA dehydrogenase
MKAKCHAAKMAVELTSASVQLTGSRAYTHSLPLDRYYRDARATMAMGPTTEIIKERIASQLLNETPWEDMP